MPPAQEHLSGPPRGRKPRRGLPRRGLPRRPWGGPADDCRASPAGLRGFTYLGMLFFVAISAAALAALGQHWSTAAQREKERELEFRGQEIARAIASYLKASPVQPPQYPASLDELLEDRRGFRPRHHLRRAYADPFTGKPDWVLVPEPTAPGRFGAVHSRSEQPLLRRLGDGDEDLVSRAADWLFAASSVVTAAAATAEPASAPQP